MRLSISCASDTVEATICSVVVKEVATIGVVGIGNRISVSWSG